MLIAIRAQKMLTLFYAYLSHFLPSWPIILLSVAGCSSTLAKSQEAIAQIDS
jgi:hypothetical protein